MSLNALLDQGRHSVKEDFFFKEPELNLVYFLQTKK